MFFSLPFFLFVFLSSIIVGTLVNPIGFMGIFINIFLIIFFYKNIFQKINKNKLIIFFILIFLIFLRISLYSFVNKIKIISNNKTIYQVTENYKSQYIVKNNKQQKILLNKNYFFKNKLIKSSLEINDKFIGCIKTKIIKKNNTNFYWFLKSKNVNYTGFITTKKCNFKIKKSNNLYNKILNYFNSVKDKKFKNWVKFLIFQQKSEYLNEIETKIKNLNIIHIFVISGFHLSIICWIWIFISKKINKKIIKTLIKVIGLLFCVFFTYLTNWKISTLKALIMFVWLLFFKEKYSKFKNNEVIIILSFLFLIFNPLFIMRIDFQLSFFISWIYTSFYKKYKKENKIYYFINLIKLNSIILILILPILININYKISIFSVINSIIFSIIIMFIYPILIISIWILPIYYLWNYIFTLMENTINFFNSWNIEILIGEIKWYLILIYYLFLIMLIRIKIKNLNKLFFISVLIFSLILFNLNNLINNKNTYKLTMFNVGHGLSMLLSNPYKKTNILFDVGIGKFKKNSRNKTILNNLLKLRIKNIDAIFISHDDKDHKNNLNYLKENINIKNIYTNKKPKKEYFINELIIKNLSYSFNKMFKKENNKSLVLFLNINNYKILLPFDIEKKGENELIKVLNDSNIDFLQVPHHGSKTSSTEPFLNKTNPKFCFISANKKSAMKKQLEKYKCKVYNTHVNGNLIIHFNKNIEINKEFY